jgi:hypothetical protein
MLGELVCLVATTGKQVGQTDRVTKLGSGASKSNMTGAAGGVFEKMYLHLLLYGEDFLRHYHARSNVETTFSASAKPLLLHPRVVRADHRAAVRGGYRSGPGILPIARPG